MQFIWFLLVETRWLGSPEGIRDWELHNESMINTVQTFDCNEVTEAEGTVTTHWEKFRCICSRNNIPESLTILSWLECYLKGVRQASSGTVAGICSCFSRGLTTSSGLGALDLAIDSVTTPTSKYCTQACTRGHIPCFEDVVPTALFGLQFMISRLHLPLLLAC